jgi:predicted RNA-binding Zn ribbon-like protein
MAGHLSLEFANTADWHAGPEPEERLTSYALAVSWAEQHGILTDDQGTRLVAEAGSDPDREAAALRRIIALRESVYHALSAVAHRRPPEMSDLRAIERESREASAHLRLVLTPDAALMGGGTDAVDRPGAAREEATGLPRFEWSWVGVEDELTGFLWPVARATTELLTSKQLAQLRECAGDPCGWLFLDLSKNVSRRWCDMADCGNRAKARRYRARKKDSTTAPGAAAGS